MDTSNPSLINLFPGGEFNGSLRGLMDYALLCAGSSFTVGVAEEECDTAPLTKMADAPEGTHKMAEATTHHQFPESHNMPTKPGSAHVMPTEPGSVLVVPAMPESPAKMATTPADAPLWPGLIASVLDPPLVSVSAAGIPRSAALSAPSQELAESAPEAPGARRVRSRGRSVPGARRVRSRGRSVPPVSSTPPWWAPDPPESPHVSADPPESPHRQSHLTSPLTRQRVTSRLRWPARVTSRLRWPARVTSRLRWPARVTSRLRWPARISNGRRNNWAARASSRHSSLSSVTSCLCCLFRPALVGSCLICPTWTWPSVPSPGSSSAPPPSWIVPCVKRLEAALWGGALSRIWLPFHHMDSCTTLQLYITPPQTTTPIIHCNYDTHIPIHHCTNHTAVTNHSLALIVSPHLHLIHTHTYKQHTSMHSPQSLV